MQKPSDERLIAYLDGELDESERNAVSAWLDRDAELRQRAAQLSESAALLRAAFDETLREPLPERLIAAAHGETSKVIDLSGIRDRRRTRLPGDRRIWAGLATAATIAGLLIGGGVGYYGVSSSQLATPQVAATPGPVAEAPTDAFPDNIAGYYKVYVNLAPDEASHYRLPQDFHVPNLKPWGLEFSGAHFLMVEGQPATQLVFTTDNKALGPITVVVANSSRPDLAATFDRRGDVNVLRWRHHGKAYALAGTADIGYLWNIHNDLAYQLDTI